MKRAGVFLEVTLTAIVCAGLYAWTAGVRPGQLAAPIVARSNPPGPRYDVIALGWDELGRVSQISDAGHACGGGRLGANPMVPVVWREGVTEQLGLHGGAFGEVVAFDHEGAAVAAIGRPYSHPQWSAVRHPHGAQPQCLAGDPRPGVSCRPYGANRMGAIVGAICDEQGNTHAFVWHADAGMTVLDGPRSCATDVNDHGVVVGFVCTDDGREVGRLWEPDADGGYSATDLTGPDGPALHPAAINNRGTVVGWLSSEAPFRWDARAGLVELPTVNRYGLGRAVAVSEQGEALGFWTSSAGARAMLWREDRAIDLNCCIDPASGWELMQATAINADGIIGCVALRNGEDQDAVLLVPRVIAPL